MFGRQRTIEARGEAPAVRSYRLRGSGLQLHMRHPWVDFWVFDEVFRRELYEPPPPVERALWDLARPIEIADLGGHVGMASLYFLGRFPSARVTSFEPDFRNARVLRRTIAANMLDDRWRLIEACAGAREGWVAFGGGQGAMSRVRGELAEPSEDRHELPPVARMALVDAFPYLERADLIKLDIEGGEWEILSDERFRELGARAVVLEFHPFLGPPDPWRAVHELLEAAGFRVGEVIEGRPEHATGNLWAWRD